MTRCNAPELGPTILGDDDAIVSCNTCGATTTMAIDAPLEMIEWWIHDHQIPEAPCRSSR